MRGGTHWVGLLLVLALAAGPSEVCAQVVSGEAEGWTPRFERAVDIEPYLPQSSVYEILEDRDGFLWFATREGLGRWDGYTMRTWRVDPFSEASLPGNQVRQLVEDAHGDLWVRAERTDRSPVGIARLVGPDRERVERYDHRAAVVFRGPDGEAWLADSTFLWRFDRTTAQFRVVRDRLTAHGVSAGWTHSDGTVWVSTSQGIERYTQVAEAGVGAPPGAALGRAQFLQPEQPAAFESSTPPFYTFAEDHTGRVWVGGVHLAYVEEDRIVTVPTPAPNIAGPESGLDIHEIVPVPGALWMATLDGVYRFDQATQAFERFTLRLPGDVATQNLVTALHRDRVGTIWAGTGWGLHRASPFVPPFRLIAHNPDDPNTIGSGIVLSLEEDRTGALWVGTLGGGLNRMGADGRVLRYRYQPDDSRSLWHDWVWAIEADADTVWVGTGGGLNAVAVANPEEVERLTFAPPPKAGWGPSAAGLHLDSDSTLWFGHIGGLYRRYTDGTFTVTTLPDSHMALQSVLTVSGGAWLTTTDGLFFYDTRAESFEVFRHRTGDPTSLPDDATIALHLDRAGRLWVGTQSGLARRDPGAEGFIQFSTDDGLPSNTVYALLEAGDGTLWASTNRGLARYDEGATPAFRAYTLADGVGNVEFNRHAAAVGRDGTFYFGGDRGVTAFHPGALQLNTHPPRVALTALHRATQDTTTIDRHLGDGPVHIAPDVSAFTFEYAALAFTNPHRNRYAVRLDGWDDAWVPMADQRRATYTNLPPGRYTFRVKASNEDGVWNETGVALPVVVAPWFWQTVWFRLLVGVALVGLVAFVAWSFSHRAYQRRLAQMEAQQALERERARISRDMHDEVGASLTEIAILSELAQLHAAQSSGDGLPATLPAAAAGRLQQIAETSRATLDAIGQIVWALNPRNDRLDHLVAYLRESTAQTLEPTDLDVVLRFPETVPARSVTTEFRRNVFLVLREAIHNLVKHAQATHATVTLRLDANELVLTVEDDGVGFASGRRFGNGLGNMRERAEEIGGRLVVESEPGTGTRLTLHAPLPQGDGAPRRRSSIASMARGLVLLALVGGGGLVEAQEVAEEDGWTPRFERAVDVEPYLPQSSVYEILEDQRGFLWFATREGLGRWDGYTMRTWRVEPFNDASLPGNVIHRMLMDGAGAIWVETQANDLVPTGIARLAAPDHERVQRFGFPDGRLFLGPNDTVWLADRDSLYRHDAATERFVAVRARLTDYLPAIALTRSDGSVWLPTYGPLVEVYDLPTGVTRLIRTGRAGINADTGTNTALGRLHEDRLGTIWLTGQALSRYDPERAAFTTVYTPAAVLDTQDLGLGASEIIEDDAGWLWLATLDGVYRFRPERPDALQRFSLLLPGDIATQNYVTALFQDRTGAFWAGTVWGLHRADPYANPFRLIAHDPADPASLGSGLVLSLREDEHGALWVGTLGGGLNRLDLATGRTQRYRWETPGGTSGSWIWDLGLRGDGTLFVCTGRGLDRVDTGQPGRIEPVPVTRFSDRPESIYTAHVDADDGVWVGQRGGLIRIDGSGVEQTMVTMTDSVAVEYLLTDPSFVWVATLRGLMQLDRQRGAWRTYRHDPADLSSLSHDAVLFLHRDRRQRLWIGTNSGLNRYVPETDGFVHYTAADGLPSDVIYAILEDDAGDLWLSTNRGLARLRATENGVAFDVFGEADGVGNVEFNRRAATRGRDGTLYFGGDRGVTAFHPTDVRHNPHPPQVVLTALHRASQDATTTERYVSPSDDAPIRIAPDVSAFTFEYAALAFTNPHRNRYAVRLDGWDEAWVPMADQRRATYTNLPPGRYTFRVKASNEDGVWNETGVALPVVVAPWFWQTVWFRLLVGVALVGLVAFVAWSFSHRAYQRRLAQMEAQQALERERARISRDMHDEVGASLTEIAILSELAQLHAAQGSGDGAPAGGAAALPDAAAGRLQQIAETSRATLDAIGQIVWALNPRNDRLDHLVAYLRESAAQTLEPLEPTGLDVVLRFPETVPARSVTTEFRRNVFLVLREALHNLVKHAAAQRATVTVRLGEEAMTLTVEDDGVGFASGRRFGNGLGNMQERAEEIGGTLVVESEPGAGTRIRLEAPLPVEA